MAVPRSCVSRLLVTGLLACGLSAHADDVRQDHLVAHAANTRDVNCPRFRDHCLAMDLGPQTSVEVVVFESPTRLTSHRMV